MASGITHILLMKQLQSILPPGRLKQTLASGRDFLQVGAVGPDLPYASILDDDIFFTDQSALADKFHYVKTNELPLFALAEINRRRDGMSRKELRAAFCFFVGFISHIVADGIIHPYIRDVVGDYMTHKTAHRTLEMKLDVMLYHYLTRYSGSPIQLNYSNIHNELTNFTTGTYPEVRTVVDIFQKGISSVYGEQYEAETILGWINGLHRMFGVAEGRHPAIYRVVGMEHGLLFADYEDLDKQKALLVLTKPIDRDMNFLHKPSIHYFDDVIPMFYARFAPLVQKLFEYVYEEGVALEAEDIFPIDLDTGRDLTANGDLSLIPRYWA
jgi:hypothetical protein